MADRALLAGALTYDPASDVATRYPEWTVATADLGGMVTEVLTWAHRTILLDSACDERVQRSSLAHALAHLDLDHRWTLPGYFEERDERAADRLASQRLIPMPALVRALAWSQDRDEVAEVLGVDRPMLEVRERELTRSERRRLRSTVRGAEVDGL